MTLLRKNERSEFVEPTNFSAAGVFEIRRRFQDACPASFSPARKPTRGSGVGGTADMLGPPDEEAQAPTTQTSANSDSDFTDVLPRTASRRASAACARFRWFDRRTRSPPFGTRVLLRRPPRRRADSPS